MLGEAPSLVGLPQRASVVVRIVLRLALGGGHAGNGVPVGAAGGDNTRERGGGKEGEDKNKERGKSEKEESAVQRNESGNER